MSVTSAQASGPTIAFWFLLLCSDSCAKHVPLQLNVDIDLSDIKKDLGL